MPTPDAVSAGKLTPPGGQTIAKLPDNITMYCMASILLHWHYREPEGLWAERFQKMIAYRRRSAPAIFGLLLILNRIMLPATYHHGTIHQRTTVKGHSANSGITAIVFIMLTGNAGAWRVGGGLRALHSRHRPEIVRQLFTKILFCVLINICDKWRRDENREHFTG